MDIRSFGEYENYYIRAREEGVSFVRGRIAGIEEDPETKKLIMNVENTITSQHIEIEDELVVLTAALIPAEGAEKIAELLTLKTDENGFFMGDIAKFSQTATELSGIYIAGTAEGPKDIPDSIVQANAAAVKINQSLK
jgi:heterodisulfide reductase subunit A